MNRVRSPQFPILFYDGACGLCDRSVRWIMARDRARVFWFAPLQGETYAALEADGKPTDASTLVLYDGERILTKSDAVVRIARTLGGVWGVLGTLGGLVPRALRDALYGAIARRRLRWFGGKEACRLPSVEERERLLA